jgi:hypothetical protein
MFTCSRREGLYLALLLKRLFLGRLPSLRIEKQMKADPSVRKDTVSGRFPESFEDIIRIASRKEDLE